MQMNKLSKIAAASLLAVAASAGAVTQDLTVQASVQSVCTFSTAARTIDFGSLDPSAAAAQNNIATNGAISYKCTTGVTPATLSVGNGSNYASGTRRMVNGADNTAFMPYTLSVTNPVTTTGQGFSNGKERTITITGSLTAAAYEDARFGSYSDTVVITVAP
jgi:spore coat protein U-like protein